MAPKAIRLVADLLRELLRLRLHVLDRARHVEGRLGQGVVRAREDLLEGANGVLEGHELALVASEDLRDLEGLRHETLDLTRALDLADGLRKKAIKTGNATHSELVLLRQLVHTENGNDILEGLVVLKDLLDGSGDRVVLLADL